MAASGPDKIYVDTNIYVDFVTNRTNENDQPLGPAALRVFIKVQKGEYKLILSTWVLKELLRWTKPEDTKMLFEMLKDNTITVSYSQEEENKAKGMSTHWEDALHAIIAKREGARYLVTRDVDHFRQYSNLVEPIHPKEF